MTDPATQDDDAAARVRRALLETIHDQVWRAPNASTLLKLAEAYAWALAPDQAHHGATEA